MNKIIKDRLIDEKYKERHKILEVLHEKMMSMIDKTHFMKDMALTPQEISNKTGYLIRQVEQHLEILNDKEHVNLDRIDNDTIYYCINKNGSVALYDKYYLGEGYKDGLDKTLKASQIITLWIGAAIALITIIKNLNRIYTVEEKVNYQDKRLLDMEKSQEKFQEVQKTLYQIYLQDSLKNAQPNKKEIEKQANPQKKTE
jgi:DNA-binding transcriptional ArsR family regulator